jgi:hypothetical protein
MHIYVYACMHTCMPTCVHIDTHTCIHTYIPQTCISCDYLCPQTTIYLSSYYHMCPHAIRVLVLLYIQTSTSGCPEQPRRRRHFGQFGKKPSLPRLCKKKKRER